MEALVALQNLATAGDMTTREDRLIRQALARSLMITPDLYNSLVFGEKPTVEELLGRHPLEDRAPYVTAISLPERYFPVCSRNINHVWREVRSTVFGGGKKKATVCIDQSFSGYHGLVL